MAKPLEKKSAKILAFILALIMLGSVLVYALKGTYTTPTREVAYDTGGFKETLKLLTGALQVYYLNFNTTDQNMVNLIDAYWRSLATDPLFAYLRFTSLSSMYYVLYPQTALGYSPYMYLFDVGSSKVFFSYDTKQEYNGVTIKVKRGYGFTENTNPVAVGTLDAVMNYIDLISGERKENSSYAQYIDRLPDMQYDFAIVLFGEAANQSIRMNGTGGMVADFYFEGIAVNSSGGYDKVVAINFLQSVFFVEAENVTQYYNVTRYNTLNIAFMHDTNFTKILTAKPEMRAVIIQPVETGNESRG
ncbi:hypothetical protein [Geoglobus ahangari]